MHRLTSFGHYEYEELGSERLAQRELLLLELTTPDQLPTELGLPSRYFVCVLVWDAAEVPSGDVITLARTLLQNDGIYFCAFGDDCERVHDCFDEEILDGDFEGDEVSGVIMTTWHAHESLDDALWHFLFCTEPSQAYARDCRCAVVLSIGEHGYVDQIKAILRDPSGFHARMSEGLPDEGAD